MTSAISPARHIRTWSVWEQAVSDGQTTSAERALVAACRADEDCTLGDGKRPTAPSDERTIGADLLRYLIIGGCDGCELHESGVALKGAYIPNTLDLIYCSAVGMTRLTNCHFDKGIAAEQVKLQLLNLEGSQCHSLNAEGAEVKGDVFLRGGFKAKGEVSLSGAQIGGQLSCTGSQFENKNGHALNAQGVEVKDSVFLSSDFTAKGAVSLSGAQIGGGLECDNGTFENAEGHALNAQGAVVTGDVFLTDSFAAKGEVSFSGAQICGQLACENGTFENAGGDALNAQAAEVMGDVFLTHGFAAKGEVSFSGAQIGGQLACVNGSFGNAEGRALNAEGAQMGAFIWRALAAVSGGINLAGARTGDLVDDAASWEMAERLYLDGFEYTSIHGPLDAPMRLEWLAKASAYDGSFSPQPYEQLAYVLKRMGHSEQRRVILLEKERLTRQAVRQRIMAQFSGAKPFAPLHAGWLWFWGFLQWLVVGYGLRPFRSVVALIALFLAGTLIFHMAYEAGDFAPNSSVILSTPEWKAVAATDANPAKAWSAKGAAGADYESFNRYAYAADIVVPIISLGQEEAWAPSTTRGAWGWHAWWLRWVLKVMGWIVTALGAAAITGIIRRE